MPTAQDDRLAELVVQRRLLTPAQLSECQQLQGQSGTPCSLAQVIVSRRYATPDALRALAAPETSGAAGRVPGTGSHARPTPSGSAVRPGTSTSPGGAAAVDDPEVAFGRFLHAQGHVTTEQVREAYRLLTGYKQQFPQVNLSQVLAKHGMCDKEVLRSAYQRFVGQRPAPAAPAPGPAAATGSAFVSAGSAARFGYQTVELDPEERPDYPGQAPPTRGGGSTPGSAFFSPFAGDGIAPAGMDPVSLDDFLPVDSTADRPRPEVHETLHDPAGRHQPAQAGPGATAGETKGEPPRGRGPGQTDGESGWAKGAAGSEGSHAGPRGTQRERGRRADASSLLAPARPVKLPPPLQLRDGVDSEGDTDPTGVVIDISDEAEPERGAGDTDIQSSTFGGAKKQQPAKATGHARSSAAPRGAPSVRVIAGIACGVVLVLSVGLWGLARSMERKNAKRDFLAAVGAEPAETTLRRREHLPAGLLADPEVAEALARVQREVEALSARAAAEAELAKLSATRTLDERLAICNAAIEADPAFAAAYVARARVKLSLSRRSALERSSGSGKPSLTADAMLDVDQAISRDPTSALAYLAKAQLYLVHQSEADARQKAQSSLQNVMMQDGEGALGLLAQGLLEGIKRDWDKAIEQFNRALQLDPKLVEALLARGEARLRKRDYAGALSDSTAAARMDGGSSEALTLQAEARLFASRDSSSRPGDRAGALKDLDGALKVDPTNGRALALRAYARLDRDRIGDLTSPAADVEQAHKDATRAVLVDPEQPLAYLALAEIEQSRKNTSDALVHVSKAVEKGRHLPVVYLVRGRLRRVDGDDQAIQDFDEVLRLEPTNARALTNKAAVLVGRKDFDNARAYLDQAIVADPELAEAYLWRGQIHLNARPRQYQLSIDDLSKAIELKAQSPDAYFFRACAFSYLNQWDDALDDLRQAEGQRKDDGFFPMRDLYLLRGHCHYQKREWKEAEEAYTAYRKYAQVGAPALAKVGRRLEEIRQALAGQDVSPDAGKFDDR